MQCHPDTQIPAFHKHPIKSYQKFNMPFLLAHPSSQEAIHQFLDANDISYENQHQNFINHLHKAAHALQHPQYRGSRDTWERKFFSEVRRDHNGVSTDVYLEALKEWLKGYKPGNGPELKGSISTLGGKFVSLTFYFQETMACPKVAPLLSRSRYLLYATMCG